MIANLDAIEAMAIPEPPEDRRLREAADMYIMARDNSIAPMTAVRALADWKDGR